MYSLILFDVDGTFYDLEDVVRANYDMRADFFAAKKGLTREETERVFARQGILPYKSEKARSATEFFLSSGIDRSAWTAYCDAHTSPAHIDREKAVSNETLRGFAALAPLVLLSSNTRKNIQDTLTWLGIDGALFDDIVCSTAYAGAGPFNKRDVVGILLERYGIPARAALSVGDRYESDILPLLALGGDGILLEKPASLETVLRAIKQDALEAWNGQGFQYYSGKTERGQRE